MIVHHVEAAGSGEKADVAVDDSIAERRSRDFDCKEPDPSVFRVVKSIGKAIFFPLLHL